MFPSSSVSTQGDASFHQIPKPKEDNYAFAIQENVQLETCYIKCGPLQSLGGNFELEIIKPILHALISLDGSELLIF